MNIIEGPKKKLGRIQESSSKWGESGPQLAKAWSMIQLQSESLNHQ